MTHGQETLLLSQAEIAPLLTMTDYIEAVERAFARHAAGDMTLPEAQYLPAAGGGFHVKSAGFTGAPDYVAVKVNGNFPDNPRRHGLPTVQGAIVLCDARTGALLAVMDSIEVTAMRTGAATAVAARHLAPQKASVATVIGCGVQGRVQLLALAAVLPLRRVYACDLEPQRATAFAVRMQAETGIEVVAAAGLEEATRASRAIVTCTSSRRPLLGPQQVAPGTFIAAVGADSPDKQELETSLMARARVVVDRLPQCLAIGELHHAVAAGALRASDVVAELGAIVAGQCAIDLAADDIVVFDSTGCAFQDVAAAGLIYERARATGSGRRMSFA